MNILGISGIFGHDAAACISINGEIMAYAEEEKDFLENVFLLEISL